MQESSVGTHGPDMLALGLVGGNFTMIVGEIKGARRDRKLYALGKLKDNIVQMSAKWIDRYFSDIIDSLVGAIVEVAGAALQEPLKTLMSAAFTRSSFEYYILSGIRYDQGWKLKGYRLLHLDDSGRRPAFHKAQLDKDLESQYPADRYLPDPPGFGF